MQRGCKEGVQTQPEPPQGQAANRAPPFFSGRGARALQSSLRRRLIPGRAGAAGRQPREGTRGGSAAAPAAFGRARGESDRRHGTNKRKRNEGESEETLPREGGANLCVCKYIPRRRGGGEAANRKCTLIKGNFLPASPVTTRAHAPSRLPRLSPAAKAAGDLREAPQSSHLKDALRPPQPLRCPAYLPGTARRRGQICKESTGGAGQAMYPALSPIPPQTSGLGTGG